jgi:hypothetical protein
MSYDLQIWSVNASFSLNRLPGNKKWQQQGSAWVYPGSGWQIVIEPCAEVLMEDIPDEIRGLLPGIAYLCELTLEPISAPVSAQKLLHSTARMLGRSSYGIIFDPQQDLAITPRGVRRFQTQSRGERFSLLIFSWWFTQAILHTKPQLENFLDLLQDALPEALPRRYGLYEPPQHTYAQTGKAHLLDFLASHLGELIVWYPHRPVVQVSFNIYPFSGTTRQGFRSNHLAVAVETCTLDQPGWVRALKWFWRKSSHLILPFYGDVRIIDGFLPMGSTFGSDIKTGFHPVKGPWWLGIPRHLGQAAVLGDPYLSLWPRFHQAAEIKADLAFLSTHDWQEREEASDQVGGVPESIAQRWEPQWVPSEFGGLAIRWNCETPPIWPFDF